MAVTLGKQHVDFLKQMVDIDLKANGIRSYASSISIIDALNSPVSTEGENLTFEFTQENLSHIDKTIDTVLKNLGVQALDSVRVIVQTFTQQPVQNTEPTENAESTEITE